MPKKVIQALSDPVVRSAGPGTYFDGGGLCLVVKPTGTRSWVLRYRGQDGKRREMGLGRAPGKKADPAAVTLAEAREKAADHHKQLRAGADPLAERAQAEAAARAKTQADKIAAITFKDAATKYIAANEAGWRNAKHRWQWTRSLEMFAYPHFGDIPVAEVGTAQVLAALEPIWAAKAETATRVRQRIEAVLDYATAREWRDGANPARWKGHIANVLPKRSKVAPVKHYPALHWPEIGYLTATLRERPAMAARALEFTILTAARSGEVFGARWREINRRDRLWIIPAERMKAGKEHRVPLSDRALAILDEMEPARPRDDRDGDAFVFPGQKTGRPLSALAMIMLLRRMGRSDLTPHGFRSTFRTWAEECTGYAHAVTEAALSHAVGNAVERAYKRTDLLEKRRRLMDDWASFCGRPSRTDDNIATIRGPRYAED
jgi:integrase